jgi:hypothetical protein
MLCVWQVVYPCSGCTSACGILSTSSGTVSDGPSSYSNYANCKWLIAPPSATRITITFTEFNTEPNYDYVYLSSCTDVSCTSAQQLLRHTGGSLPSPQSYTSNTGFLMVEFTSDLSIVNSGFTATWTSEAAVRSSLISFAAHVAFIACLNQRTTFCVKQLEKLMILTSEPQLVSISLYMYVCNIIYAYICMHVFRGADQNMYESLHIKHILLHQTYTTLFMHM